MKSIQILAFLLFPMFLIGQNINPYTTGKNLQDAVTTAPDDWHKVMILFTDRIDAVAMAADFSARNLTLSERNVELLSALKEKANTVQAPYLVNFQTSEQVRNVQSYWVTNLIYAEMKGDYIAELSQDMSIDLMDLKPNPVLMEYKRIETVLPVSPNGTEVGLRLVEADSMWARGYTGYGRIAYCVDTGTEPTHPALTHNYLGNNVPASQAWNGFGSNDDYPYDCDDHGTHVAGTMVGLDRLTNDTIGMAFEAQWMASPDISCSPPPGSNGSISAFQWALDPDGNPATIDDMPDVMNNSWGIPGTGNDCGSFYQSTLDALEATKIAVIFSAGNEGSGAFTISIPAGFNGSLVNSFAVGAVSPFGSNTIAGFSSRGPSGCPGTGALDIKPEVCAPGVSTRSSVRGGGYSSFQGTSMAAPHVSGAILLLREAFPTTTATEIKMALYESAIDLGELGEDNSYGRGLINLPAAYNYLIDQGFTPLPPASRETDVTAVNSEVSPNTCADNFSFNLSFENNGTSPLETVTINYEIADTEGSFDWTGSLLKDETTTVSFGLQGVPTGENDLLIELTQPNGLMDDRPLNNKILRRVFVSEGEALIAYAEGDSETYCESSEVSLRLDYQGIGSVDVTWYDDLLEGNEIGEGEVLTVGPLTETQSFFAESLLKLPVGKESNSGDNTTTRDNPTLRFDAFQEFKLKSVLVYFDEPGVRLFRVLRPSGAVVASKITNVAGTSPQRILLNINVPVGNNMSLELTQGLPLKISSEGASFPYELSDIVRIESSLGGSNTQNLSEYHAFYDWEVTLPHPCGRVQVTVPVAPGENTPTAEFSASETEIDLALSDGSIAFTNTSIDAVTYLWNFGDGTTETVESPLHSYNASGIYTVSLVATNADGCTDSFIEEITVTESFISNIENSIFADWNISTFPNPTNNQVTIDFSLKEPTSLAYRLVDIYGRIIHSVPERNYTQSQAELNLSSYASGVYYLVFSDGNQQTVRRVVKM